jgi:hypothetical protein
MRIWLSALAILIGLGVSVQTAPAQNAMVEKMVQAKKVYRMTIYNGPRRTIHYFPLVELTSKELAALRAQEREANALPKLTITLNNNGKIDTVEGTIVGMAGDWVIVERNNGIERIREAAILSIFEPRPEILPPGVSTPEAGK